MEPEERYKQYKTDEKKKYDLLVKLRQLIGENDMDYKLVDMVILLDKQIAESCKFIGKLTEEIQKCEVIT